MSKVTLFRWPLWPSWAQYWLEIQVRPILSNAISKKHSHNSHKWPHSEKLEADLNLFPMTFGKVAWRLNAEVRGSKQKYFGCHWDQNQRLLNWLSQSIFYDITNKYLIGNTFFKKFDGFSILKFLNYENYVKLKC